MAKQSEPDPAARRQGERVRYWRMKRNLTLRQLAEKAAISKSALSRIEQGHQELKAGEFERLVEVLELSIGRFFRVKAAA